MAGSPAVVPVSPPTLQFNARLEGDSIVVDVNSSIALSMWSCSGAIALEKYDSVNGAWVAPHDDRHPDHDNPGYYLDGVFVPPSFHEGCDVLFCEAFPRSSDRVEIAPAYEYVKTGTAAPPSGAAGAPDQVDVVERRPLSGTVRIRIDFFEDDACRTPSRVLLDLDIPLDYQGVCCPIGSAQCSSEGPGGGWAPNLDSCKPFETTWDAMFEQRVDPHGCPVLVENPDICCGCVPDADGGI